jgi:hypothetical protein
MFIGIAGIQVSKELDVVCTSVIPTLRKLGQEDLQFQASLEGNIGEVILLARICTHEFVTPFTIYKPPLLL